MSLSQYKDIFGKPNEGAHAKRLGPFAAVDVIMLVIVAIIIAAVSGKSFLLVTSILFLSGVAAHRLFGVRTALDKMLFKD